MGCEETSVYEVLSFMLQSVTALEGQVKIMMWLQWLYFLAFMGFGGLFFWCKIRGGR